MMRLIRPRLSVVELQRVDSEHLPVLIHVADELPDPLVSSIDDALELRPERLPLAILGRESDQPIDITRVERAIGSTFSCDIGYSVSPTALRASASVRKLPHQTSLPLRTTAACHIVWVTSTSSMTPDMRSLTITCCGPNG